jgi:hypothetical protein
MVLIQLLLPTAIGAERRDATALFVDTRRELADRFKGITAYVRSPAKDYGRRRKGGRKPTTW